METVYIRESEKEYRIPLFLVRKNRFFTEGDICVYEIPRMKRKKAYFKICNYMKKKGVKKVCFSKLSDPVLAYDLKTEFHYIDGEEAFRRFFVPVLEFFAQKKGILLKESTVVFISDDVKKTELSILEIYRKVKKIAVYTRCMDAFQKLSDKFRTEYGVYVEVRNAKTKPKKYRHIYINTEKQRIMEDTFFGNCHCIDIHRQYKGAYNEVSFNYKTPFDAFLKEHKIEKKLSFTEYFMQNSKKDMKKDYKIINIIKL